MKLFSISLTVSALLLTASCGKTVSVKVSSQPQSPAGEQIVELDPTHLGLNPAKSIIVTDETDTEIPHQTTHDGKLLFPATLQPGESALFTLKESDIQSTYDTIAYAQLRPDKQDDFTWENAHGGYRLYGPSYHRGNGPVRGYDIWTKSVSYPTLAKRYENDHNGISYHVDQGDGMDPYTVGKTLGAGLACPVDSAGQYIYPRGYKTATILDNGPLRLTVRLDIDPIVVDGDTVTETRTVTLDRNAWLNKTTVSYQGLSHPSAIASGIVVHKQNPEGFRMLKDANAVVYDDFTDNPDNNNGIIYIGVINPQAEKLFYQPFEQPAGDALGHVIATHTCTPDDGDYTYYWGSGWSEGGVGSSAHWDKIVRDHYQAMRYPYTVEIIK